MTSVRTTLFLIVFAITSVGCSVVRAAPTAVAPTSQPTPQSTPQPTPQPTSQPTSQSTPQPAPQPYLDRPDVQAFISRTATEQALDPAQIRAVLGGAQRSQAVLDAIARPAEKRLNWARYSRIFLQPDRIAQGVQFWDAQRPALERAAARFGVPPQIVVAIIGVETRYGKFRGKYLVRDALTTLAFDYPPRSAFFSKELGQYLRLAHDEGWDVAAVRGSYAGAMGYGQFISSSYRAYAVDFDGDGLRDLLNNQVDAIGSVANYFRENGWQPGGVPWVAAKVTGNGAALAGTGLKLNRTVAELRAAGVTPATDVPDDAPATLIRYETDDGLEYWIALQNFYAVTRYNHSHLYARAVLDLAAAIVAARAARPPGVASPS